MRTVIKTVTKIKLQKGDLVMVRAGRDKGKTGKVLASHPTTNKVTVDGINIVKKHQKPTRANPQGGIVEINKPLAVCKLGIYNSTTKKMHRISYQIDAKGNKRRRYSGSQQLIKTAAVAKAPQEKKA